MIRRRIRPIRLTEVPLPIRRRAAWIVIRDEQLVGWDAFRIRLIAEKPSETVYWIMEVTQ